ncbi:MAG: GNAT family N-acetyltransferase [Clostridiales bacterium]|nr:GNAT family N-acetyltransferase [Clostridiales bacterium]MDU6975538.1 GNAT family N-acetyltransferase [Clostridiales bacterium]
MKLLADKLSEEQAKELTSWHYPEEYSIYNLPSWEIIVQKNYSLADSIKREKYIGYMNDAGELVGFVNLSLTKEDTVFFGIGVNPKYCDMGVGKTITKMALIESQKRFPNKPVVLEVRTWNKRAINCYKSQGFEIIGTTQQETYAGEGEFYIMRYTGN